MFLGLFSFVKPLFQKDSEDNQKARMPTKFRGSNCYHPASLCSTSNSNLEAHLATQGIRKVVARLCNVKIMDLFEHPPISMGSKIEQTQQQLIQNSKKKLPQSL